MYNLNRLDQIELRTSGNVREYVNWFLISLFKGWQQNIISY